MTETLYRVQQAYSNVNWGDGDPIDQNVNYRILREITHPTNINDNTEVVVERADKQSYAGESRWIVNKRSLLNTEEVVEKLKANIAGLEEDLLKVSSAISRSLLKSKIREFKSELNKCE